MHSLKDIVSGTLRQLGIIQRFNAETVVLRWRQIVGGDIAAHTRPDKIRRGVLTVGTASGVWAHHLSTMKEDIIAKINSFAGSKVVIDIKFTAGYYRTGPDQEESAPAEAPAPCWRDGALEGDEQGRIEKLAGNISDEALKQKVKRILYKEFCLRKAKRRLEWNKCQSCGVLCSPQDSLCTVCGLDKRAGEIDKLRKIINQAPWISYKECKEYADCRLEDFRTVKNELIDALRRSLQDNEADRVKIMILVMLINGVEPQAITQEMVDRTLEKVRRRKNVFAFRG